jgi:hypothetical protein
VLEEEAVAGAIGAVHLEEWVVEDVGAGGGMRRRMLERLV